MSVPIGMIESPIDTVTALIESAFDVVPLLIQMILHMIDPSGEAMFDFIALAVETLRHAYFPLGRDLFRSGMESMVDATTLGFEPIIARLCHQGGHLFERHVDQGGHQSDSRDDHQNFLERKPVPHYLKPER
jgi:hypothetical protein